MATYRNIRKVLNLPTLSANPASGINGEMYFNTTDLALYIYDGMWKIVTQSALPTVAYGSSKGFVSAGLTGLWTFRQAIDSYSMTSDGNATDQGDLGSSMAFVLGVNSLTHAYTLGGRYRSGTTWYERDYIFKYAMASASNGSDIGDMTNEQNWQAGCNGQMSSTHGYKMGGSSTSNVGDKVEKISFSSDGNASAVGSMSSLLLKMCGINSDTKGYAYQGNANGGYNAHGEASNVTFASDAIATVGYFAPGSQDTSNTSSMANAAGVVSPTAGYAVAGTTYQGTGRNVITKVVFASEAHSTISGTALRVGQDSTQGSAASSASYGFVASVPASFYGASNTIEKLDTSADSNMTDVGDLVQSSILQGGHHI